MARLPPIPRALAQPSRLHLRAASTVATPTTTSTGIVYTATSGTLPPSRSPFASAKLPALHARLNLHPNFPLPTLARALIDPSADCTRDPNLNNANLATLGNTLTGYFAAEHLLTLYPRLPSSVLYAAVGSIVGNAALASLARSWGLEAAFEPTAEVDAGLLQFRRLAPGTNPKLVRGQSGSTLEHAAANAVRAVFAGVFLHEGLPAALQFFRQHVAARKLDIEKMFDFEQPTRELSRLCAREGMEAPVARMLAETGRRSRHPVFVVGVYSGGECMGEGHGGSLDEARIRAAAMALKSWYLYSPVQRELPSKTMVDATAAFKPQFVDVGEVIV